MNVWINQTTKVTLKEKAMVIYLVGGINYDKAKVETIEFLSKNGFIILSNGTTWTLARFTKALESGDLEIICHCNNIYSVMEKIPYFSLYRLACISCHR